MLRLFAGGSLVLALGVLPACQKGEGGETSASTGSTGSTGTPTTGGSGTTTTGGANSSDPGMSPTTASESSGEPACLMGGLGEACVDPACDCASGNCFVVGPLGGVCSECVESADCKPAPGFGCNFGNPLTGTPAVCSQSGDAGESCEVANDCADGLSCPTLIEVPGILVVSTCSVCGVDADCTGLDLCAPTYDLANFGGQFSCHAPGSVPNDAGCNLTGDGSECTSGQCAPAALMGIPVVGVCSACNEDTDCGGGQVCTLPEVVIAGDSLELVPGSCA